MALTNRQKGTVARYRALAGLNEFEYRKLLNTHTGKRSTTDERFGQRDFMRVLLLLEMLVGERYGNGEIDDLKGIRDLQYWRKKAPRDGCITTAQVRKIETLQDLLRDAHDNPIGHRYLMAAINQACCQRHEWLSDLSSTDASLAIEALKAMLKRQRCSS